MALFTVILDFNGGTYVSQVKSSSVKYAVKKWAQNLNTDEIDGMGVAIKSYIVNQGLERVWCSTASTPKGFCLINIVETVE